MLKDDIEIWNNTIKGIKPLYKKNNIRIEYLVNKINTKINNIQKNNYVLDLHGYSIQNAYDILLQFIIQHSELKTKYVIVITGKGTKEKEGLIHKEIITWFNTNKFNKYIKNYEWINNNGALKIYLMYNKKSSNNIII